MKYNFNDKAFEQELAKANAELEAMKVETVALVESAVPQVQHNVHVNTGALQSTVRANIGQTENRLRAEILIGHSPEIEYAVYENSREGHEFFKDALDMRLEQQLSTLYGAEPTEAKGSVHHTKGEALN